MSVTSVKLNTPAPYFSLSKGCDLPQVVVVSTFPTYPQQSIEDDISILSTHKCIPKMCTTRIVTGDTSIPMPIESVKANLNDSVRFIKLGKFDVEDLRIMQQTFTRMQNASVVASGHDMTRDAIISFPSGKVEAGSSTLVITLDEALAYFPEYFESAKLGEGNLEIAKLVAECCTFQNILLLNTVPGGNSHIYYSKQTGEQLNIESKSPVSMMSSTVATATIANLSHGYTIKEAIYGALEFVQNAVILADSNKHPNYMYSVSLPLECMVNDECFEAHEIRSPKISSLPKPKFDSFYQYLIQHPLVKPSWEAYTNHDFVRQIADGILDINKFKFFIEQDYSYLVDYGRVHCIAGSKAPELENMEEELVIVGRIREEMGQHEQRLKEVFGVKDDSYFKTIERGTALNNYSRYFNDIARRGSWEELVAALTPCMMGYGAAAMKFKNNVKAEKGGMYDEWINIYSCENYEDGMRLGEKILNHIAERSSAEELERLAKIYGEVCALEAQFWDAALVF